RAREDLLSRLHAPGGDRRDAAGPALAPAWFRGASPAPAAAQAPGAVPVPPAVPPSAHPRPRAVAPAPLDPAAPPPVRVLLTADPAGREWGLELSPAIEGALARCDGARTWAEIAAELGSGGGDGRDDADALLAELVGYGAIEA